MTNTTYHGWHLPDGTDMPFVHLDMKALADAIDKDLPVHVDDWNALQALPPIMNLKALVKSKNYRLFAHNGTQWVAASGGGVRHLVLDNSALVGNATGLAAKITSGEVELVNLKSTVVSTTDGAGYVGLNYPAGAFPNGVLTATWNNGDSAAGGRDAILARSAIHTADTSRLVLSVVDAANNAVINRTMRFEMNVWGW